MHDFIDRYTDDEGLVSLPPFHGCLLKKEMVAENWLIIATVNNVFVQYGAMTNQNLRAVYFPLLGIWDKVKTDTFLKTK